ncbi:MAG: nucleotidyltransferase domain-containing protein [Thermodesulfobacteriota bacterium]|nr:nucleotidyltransferase domain-containing protein [Thermodesulfobacteriota bacterium]
MGLSYGDYREFLESLLMKVECRFAPARIIAVALFGSVSRGEAGPYSDIDLLFIHEHIPDDPIKRLVDVILKIREKEAYHKLTEKGLFPEPSCIFMTPRELSQNPLILLDIMDHGIMLKDEEGFLAGKIRVLQEKLARMGAYKIVLKDGSWAWDLKPDYKIGEVFEITL